jgi:hypothetical protein
MILQFPNLDALRLALTSATVPAEVSLASATAAFRDDGAVLIQPAVKVPLKAQKALQKLGVQTVREFGEVVAFECLSWGQVLPVVKEAVPLMPTAQTPVLFELPDAHLLPQLAGEILRLGNDRQSFRFLAGAGEPPRALLRVYGPPYYSLLQALERTGRTVAPRAYLERAPRLWVEIGCTHPLLEILKAPEKQMLLLRPPHDWDVLDEAPFQDIYEILEFPLPHGRIKWYDQGKPEPLTVPLRLAQGSSSEVAELWVVRDQPQAQLDALVRDASDQLLSRFTFAVAEAGDQQTVVLRLRPSRQPAPVLVLDAQGYRPYLKLPNLFVPCGSVLLPPLRRDVVRKLLAEDQEQVIWLHPQGDGTFTPESLPDRAFRPLSEWVEYVLTREHAVLTSWVEATTFDFERFICKDETKPAGKAKEKKPRRSEAENTETIEAAPLPGPAISKGKAPPTDEDDTLTAFAKTEPTELQKQARALEQQFLAIEGPLDAAERQALWPDLARVYTALQNWSDAGICWSNALWEDDGQGPRLARLWHLSAARSLPGQSLDQVLDTLTTTTEPHPGSARVLVAALADAAHGGVTEATLRPRLGQVQVSLQKHEHLLPVRTVWLAAQSIYRLSGGDVLALARTRDRILERLHQTGLTAETDLPSFLRFTGNQFNDRFRDVRDWLLELPGRVRHWLEKVVHSVTDYKLEETVALAHLILAFGFARLGEGEQALRLFHLGHEVLNHREDVHILLLRAFEYRIDQALGGEPLRGPLPLELLEKLAASDRISRYAVDRLRQHSQILEPQERIEPYRTWYQKYGDGLQTALNELTDVLDRDKLEGQIQGLFQRYGRDGPKSQRNRARILRVALELSPRIGETFAAPLLEEVLPAADLFPDLLQKAGLLEQALLVAAHFDQAAHVERFVARFQELLSQYQDAHDLKSLDSLAGQCFRGLRKMGMRETIHKLLTQLSDALLQGKTLARARSQENWPILMRSLLQVAAGWYYFGMDDQAQPMVDEARRLLLKEVDIWEGEGQKKQMEKCKLATAYIAALGRAPADVARGGINEVFAYLTGITSNWATNKYYSLSQLDVVEAVVLAIASDDFAMGNQARRWLDEEEFLVRRRIHQDVRTALQQHA